MRGRLPDRRCILRAAARRHPVADLRAMLLAYHEAGGTHPVLLLHDSQHGTPLIDALARHGDGLPANVLPLAVNELTQVGLEAIIGAFAYGAAAVRFLLRARPRHDVTGLSQTIAMADAILAGLGFDGRRVATIETDDPDALGAAAAGDRNPCGRRDARNLQDGRQAARSASICLERIASPRADAGRRDRPAAGRARRRDQRQHGRMHAVPVLCLGLPDRRASRRSRAARPQIRRRRLRAMRPVPEHLPGKGHHAQAADRFPRGPRAARR